MAVSQQVVIVGAGIAGASVAFGLARRGCAATVVDADRPGQATAAGAGIVAPWDTPRTGPYYDLYAAGAAFYPSLIAALVDAGVSNADYAVTGSLVVNGDRAELDAVEARIRGRLAAAGPAAGRAERLSNADARRLFPPLSPDLAAVLMTGGARVDGRKLRDALLATAERLGVRRVTGTATLARDGGGRVTVAVDRRPLRADAVVVAGGSWADGLLAEAGCPPAAVVPQRGQITHLHLAGVDTAAWPAVMPLADHYLLPFANGRIVAGATREADAGFDPRVTAAGQLRVLADALAIAPGLADATLLETRVGLRPLPANGLPIVGDVGGGASVITGFGPAGLTMGPLAGDALARQLLGEPAAELAACAPGNKTG